MTVSPPSSAPLHLMHVFSTFDVGGQQTRFVTLVKELGRRYRHTILAMDNRFGCAARLDRGTDWRTMETVVTKTASLSLGNLARFRRLLRQERPDLLLTYNWGAVEWALVNRWLPICRHLHFEDGFGPEESPTRQNPRRVLMRRIALSGRTRIIVPSRTLHDLATGTWRFEAERVLQIPNGIDCARFDRPADPALVQALGLGEGELVVGTVAALRPEKNIGRLLRVFGQLPRDRGYRLIIIGDGPERDSILIAAAELGIAERVTLTGALDQPERLLGRFSLFALTSDTEQMPYSVLEAMAAGLPVVATDVGDVKRILPPESAPYVIARDDEFSLGRAMLALLEDGAERHAIGTVNRAHVAGTYSLDTMLERYDRLFGAA